RFAGDYIVFGAGIPATPELAAAIPAHIEALVGSLAPWDMGAAYLNFTEATEDPAKFYSPGAYDRLRRVKADVDPDGIFRRNHAVTVDLRRVSFLDCLGLRLLVAQHRQAPARGCRIDFIQGPPAVRRVFELTGTLEALSFVEVGAAPLSAAASA